MSDHDLDRLLTGKLPPAEEASEQLAALVRRVKTTYRDAPGETAEVRHLVAIVEAARLVAREEETSPLPVGSANQPTGPRNWRKTLSRNRLVVRTAQLAGAGLAAVLATAGLAFAGVSLPTQAQDAFNSVGLDLPNQAGGDESAGQPSVVPNTTKGSDVGDYASENHPSGPGPHCDFGQTVADKAGASLPTPATDACDQAGSNANPQGSSQTGESHSQSGRSTAEAAPQGSRQTGENHSQGAGPNVQTTPQGSSETGQSFSQQAPTTSTPAPPTETPSGPPTETPSGPPTETPGGPPAGTP